MELLHLYFYIIDLNTYNRDIIIIMKKIFSATAKIVLTIGLGAHCGYSMEDLKHHYNAEQVRVYSQVQMQEEDTRAFMERRYADHHDDFQKIFEDYERQPVHINNPSILVIGAGHAHEVRVLRDLNKSVSLIVEPEAESLELAKSIGNIVNEETFNGLVQDVPSEWNAKFDIVLWQYFVASDYVDTLKSIHNLLKPNGIFYPASDSHMLSLIQSGEEIPGLYNVEAVIPVIFPVISSDGMGMVHGILRLTKK